MNEESTIEQIKALGPWHLEVEVAPGLTTAVGVQGDNEGVVLIDGRDQFRSVVTDIYPDGLQGRRFLDCACNCGGYSFWARELGASKCFGFDVRDHWIKQARFLAEQRGEDNATFEVLDLYDLPDLDPFDVTLFKGIFYHLPDPITGLKRVTDMTTEVLILNTATRHDYPDGVLVPGIESTVLPMSGVHGLCWYPSGPKTLEPILSWLGFEDIRVVYWNKQDEFEPAGLGRLEMVARR